MLHHGVVDRIRRAGGEGRLVQAAEVEVAVGVLHRGLGGLGDGRRVLLDLGQEAVGAEHEHAAVPVEAAVGDEAFGGVAVRLLDEALDLVAVIHARQRLAAADVAVAGLGRGRDHAEGRQRTALDQRGRALDRHAEGIVVLDHVVGRQHQHHRLRILGQQVARRGRHRRGGVAADRLEQDALRRDADFAHLFGDHETVLVAAHHQRRHQPRPAAHP